MTDTTPMKNAEEVVTFLVRQHNEIKGMFSRVARTQGSERQESFDQLRRLLAIHESAEELIVHPRAKRELSDGDTVIEHLLEEEDEAKHTLADIEDLDVDSTEFEVELEKLRQAVLHHAQEEEKDEFARLVAAVDEDTLIRMRRAVELAEATAPTHPRPGIGESRAANVLVGPFAAMVDRARDLISGTDFRS